ncbi:MAG: hypothetical protein Q9167_002148 [Letrouitia subvulpina]
MAALMAQSCYDPEEAARFWTRMEKAEKYAPPQFLSTHPAVWYKPNSPDRLLIRHTVEKSDRKNARMVCGPYSRIECEN